MPLWGLLLLLLATLAIGLPLMARATAPLRKSRKAFAVASALFFSFGIINPAAEKISEAREDGETSKRQKPGDPPEPH
ncbi:MAG: hypothetical protein JSR60_08130 [Proteobacteria bacterium]|nr:hypothetical protein [Pseudomonadota bacterium]